MADIDTPLSWRMQQDGYLMQIDKLRTENAKLRDLMYERAHRHAIQHMTEDELRIVATNVLDENAKLRELVASVWRLFAEHGAVHPSDLPEVDAVRNDMRELGIEVDDG